MEATLQYWQFIFREKDGFDNRDKFMANFLEFLKSDEKIFIVKEKTRAMGMVHGHPKFEDGSTIWTSDVRMIEKRFLGKQNTTLDIHTGSGSIYTILCANCAEGMRLMIKDYDETGKLSTELGRYVNKIPDCIQLGLI